MEQTQTQRKRTGMGDFRKGIRDGVPIALGYLSVSFTFGMMAAAGGMPTACAVLISMTNLTSAGQFAGLPLLLTGGGYLEMALTQLVINLRYALMSISLSQKLAKSITLPQRLLIAFGNTDEIFAVASGQKGEVGKSYMYGLIALPYIGWSLGTFLGAAADTILPQSVRTALGMAIYGMFLAILLPAAKRSKAVLGAIVLSAGLSCAFAYLPFLQAVSSGFVIIICAVAAAAVGALFAPVQTEEQGATAT